MTINWGPAGIGGTKEAEEFLSRYKKQGIQAAEIPFTYQVWIKSKEVAKRIKRAAKKNKIELSVHTQYWINLNSKEKDKVESSKKRILRCAEVGSWLGAKKVVFHCGFYSKMDNAKAKDSGIGSKEEVFQNIKKEILDMKETIKKNKWDIQLCPEVMGKINVFGSIDEISRLVNETGCGFCIDFAHVLARYKKYDIEKLKKAFPQKTWHCHFSGIEYGEKGEKHHKRTEKKEIEKLVSLLPKNKNITIINESPSPIDDTVLSLRIYAKS